MPWECIPEDELLWTRTKLHQRAPDNRRRRFGKTIWAFLTFARAARCYVRKDFLRLDSVILLFTEQDSLGSHGDSAEMTAAIAERFAYNYESRLAKPLSEISA
jgi:hypothetical protein